MGLASSLLLDTSGLIAALFPDQRQHPEAARVLAGWEGRLLLSPFVLAELDYLIAKWGGLDLAKTFLKEVAARAYDLVDFSAADVEQAVGVLEHYDDLGIGLADASLVVLSRRYGVVDLLSLDERHFRTVRGAGESPFRLLPIDLGTRASF